MKNKAFFPGIFLFFLTTSISFSQPDLVTTPFRTVGKMILIQGNINGHFGNLIIDTGISGMVLNKAYFSENEIFRTDA